MRLRDDDTRTQSSMWMIVGRFPRSSVGNGEAPARFVRAVPDQDFALLAAREGMLQSVDHELRHDQSKTDGFVGDCFAGSRFHLDRDRPTLPDHRGCETLAQLRQL